jgi:DNA-binding response OmpR family regulator
MKNKILIVEDEVALMMTLVDNFSKDDWDVYSAENGREGLESALKNHPDIILLDIIMPLMDGMKMLEELRKDSWGKNARVILLTNLSDEEKKRTSAKLNVESFDYWVKCDMSIDEVVAKAKERLRRKIN